MFQDPIQYYSLLRWTLLYHQSHPQQGIVFTLAPSLPCFWSYFPTVLQYHIGLLLTWGVHLTVSFKGVDLIDRVCEGLWTEVCNIVKEVMIKTIPKKKKCKKVKWLFE